MLYETDTDRVIGAFFKVYNELGFGFLEKVYENAMAIMLSEIGFHVSRQFPIEVTFHDQPVGKYYADIVINEKIILELKAESALHPMHEAQLINYLKATDYRLGLLFNFGEKPQFKRKVWK